MSTYRTDILSNHPQKPWLLAVALNLVLFSVFIILINPIYDTNEDVHMLYLLSGNFGSQPTELFHYNHILHPYLGLALKNLFRLTDNVNWYTIFLFLAHLISSCIIAFHILLNNQKTKAIIAWITLFIVFECKLLLTINFTNTSIILGCAGVILASHYQENKKITPLIFGACLLIIASFFRIHTLIPVVGMSLPFIFSPFTLKRAIPVTATLAITVSIILLFNQLHQSHYKSKIPGWQAQENYSQKIYLFYNNQHLYRPYPNEKWYTEFNLIKNGLPIDTGFLSSEKLLAMNIDLKSKKNVATPAPATTKNWFWINNRLYFCTTFILLLLAGIAKRNILRPIVSLALVIAGLTLLSTNAKLPEYLIISCLYLLGIFTLINPEKRELDNPFFKVASFILLFCMIIWGAVRMYKINKKNNEANDYFRSAHKEIAKHPDYLFIITGDRFPLQKFSVKDLPKNFPLPNFLNSEHFMHNIYTDAFKKFNISNTRDLPGNNNVLFWGKRVDALENYFTIVSGKQVTISPEKGNNSLEEAYHINYVKP